MTKKDHLCPCGSKQSYNSCCQRVIKDQSRALTAEMLMRSRYSAYVKQESAYLLASWHKSKRPDNLDLFAHPVVWLGLEIHKPEKKLENDNSSMVDFSCFYLEKDQFCTLREQSNFLREQGLWFYLDGQCSINRKKVPRNSDCPCGSGKKFKRCCLSG